MAGRLSRGSTGPAESVVPVTPSDADDLPNGPCRGLLCGTGGALTIIDGGGATRTAVPMQVGYNPIVVQRVFETGSTADNIWALY